MAKILAVTQVKGGTGRSTVATTLAGELSKNARTVLIDCDMPQGTSASWFAVRQEAGLTDSLLGSLVADTAMSHRELVADTAMSHRELVDKVEQYSDADYIVIDGPPRLSEITRATLVLADLCLVPVGASRAEIWATTDIVELIRQAENIKKVNARMIWTRYRQRTKLTQELTGLANGELGLEPLTTTLGMRGSYIEALGDGRTAAELPDLIARLEVRSLTAEVQKLLRRKPS